MNIEYFKETFHLLPESNKPLYQQLYEYFKRLILNGTLQEGDQMLPEIQICEAMDLSRSTVRKTMDKLIEDGLILRRRGKGSYVTSHKLRRQINYLYNFSENMESIGVHPSSIVLECKVLKKAPKEIREILRLPSENPSVFLLKRIRLADGEPILCENTYIPYHLCPGIQKLRFSSQSLYTILLERYLLEPYRATESIEAVFLSDQDKELLECTEDIPGFKISRVSYLESGEIFEYTTSLTRADKCVFTMELFKNPSPTTYPIQIRRNITV